MDRFVSGCDSQSWPLIVSFGVREEWIDHLIESTQGTRAEAIKWFVFGTQMRSLRELDLKWRGSIELVIACIPAFDESMIDIAFTILENEGAKLGSCVWLDGTGLVSKQACRCARVIQVDDRGIEGIALELFQ
jgi:hypothetical protein